MKIRDYFKGLSDSGKFDYLEGDGKSYNWRKPFLYLMTVLTCIVSLDSCSIFSKTAKSDREGVPILMGKCEEHGLKTAYNVKKEPIVLWLGGESTEFVPDGYFYTESGEKGLIEFLAKKGEQGDSLRNDQLDFIIRYNATQGTVQNKTLHAKWGKERDIEDEAEDQLYALGFNKK